MTEKKRYYECRVRKEGKSYRFRHRNDNMELAYDHARLCAADWGGYLIDGSMKFIGKNEPPRCGEFIEV